ncbi:DnaD domain protein [Peptostreptococcus faecalis]|uniref:DnaD domain protein n=1 Tax=Peptostreptococcus faecalis TaxID=2045015 RepID=UPI000C7B28A8|nr:DnaD domain protein [Peptostreptococcus faecalis]
MFFKSIVDEIYNDVTIPSIFFDMYIPIADGNQIKVYLLGYKSAFFYNGMQSDELDNKTISNVIGITEEEVISAWKFWESMGVVKIHNPHEKFLVEFLDIKSQYLKTHSQDPEEDSIVETAQEASSYAYIDMYNKIEDISGRLLTPNEKIEIMNSLNEYEMSPELAVIAFEKAAEENGRIKSVNYVTAILKSWFDNSIKTVEDIEYRESERDEKFQNYKIIFKNLGFNRTPTSYEKEVIDKWFYKYEMNLDLVLKACSKSINTSNPNIKYFDKIISSWYEKGIKTVEDVELEDEKFAKDKSSKSHLSKKTIKTNIANKKTKFHNFNQSISDKYSDDELNKIVRNLNKK